MSILFVTGMTAALLSAAAWVRHRAFSTPLQALDLAPNDPLMLQATAEARASLDRLRDLAPRHPGAAHVKVRHEVVEGTTEYLWAELLDLREDDMDVFLVNLPMSHSGPVERNRTFSLDDLVDWQVEHEDGHFEGGATMRVMFTRAREQWGGLPQEMTDLERRYAASPA